MDASGSNYGISRSTPSSPSLSGRDELSREDNQHCTEGVRGNSGGDVDNRRPINSFTMRPVADQMVLCGTRYARAASSVEDASGIADIKRQLEEARANNLKISLLGSGYSQGGQTRANGGSQIDMRHLNKVINIDPEQKRVTVQAGITWKELQNELAPLRLSVSAMQSYADFSVGGSIGVNAHGQDVNWNPVSRSVVSMRALLTDGRYLETSRTRNPELFKALIGTYGLIGIIAEVTLDVLPNNLFKKTVERVETKNYCSYVNAISRDRALALHSARISIDGILWPFYYSIAINYHDTNQLATREDEEREPCHTDAAFLNTMKQNGWTGWFTRKLKATGEYLWAEPTLSKMSRNQVMGESVKSLENTEPQSKDILQEYFIPPDNLYEFIQELKAWKKGHSNFTLLNATIRKVNADRDSLLPYAPEDRFAIVLFINLPDNNESDIQMRDATRGLIDVALKLGGRFYLPYALYATQDQIFDSYPEWPELISAKSKFDKDGLLENRLYQTYFTTG